MALFRDEPRDISDRERSAARDVERKGESDRAQERRKIAAKIGKGTGAFFGGALGGPIGAFIGGAGGEFLGGQFGEGGGGMATGATAVNRSDRDSGFAQGVTGALGIGGNIIGSRGAEGALSGAVGAEQAGILSGIGEQRRQFDITRGELAPFREAGVGALQQQQALLGLGGQEAQQAAFAAFGESPGQKFLRDRQERALLRNTAAIGGLGGGNVRTALQQQAAGFAQQDLQNQFNRLGALSGAGLGATTAGGQFGAQTASNIAGLQQAGAASRASGILGKQQLEAQQTEGIANILGLFSEPISEGLSSIGSGISSFFE